MIIKNHFHKKDFTLGLVLKQRLAASQKWHIKVSMMIPLYKNLFAKMVTLYDNITSNK